MARIPTGQYGTNISFGGRIAETPRGVAIPQAAMRDDAGAILADSAVKALSIVDQGERQRQADANRVQAVTAQATVKNGLNDLLDDMAGGLADGRYDKTKIEADYAERSEKLIEDAVKNVPPGQQELVRASLIDDHGRGKHTVKKLVDKQNTQDIRGGIVGYIEQMQRYGVRGEAERGEAITNVEAFVRATGAQAGMAPAEVEKTVAGFKEGVTYTFLDGRVTNARHDKDGLKALAGELSGDKYAELDPQKRNALVAKIDVYETALIQRQNALAERAAREAERKLKVAEAEFNTFQAMADKGTLLDAAYVDRAVANTSGTPYQAGIVALAKQAREVGGLAAQTITAQQNTLTAIDQEIATKGRSPALDKRREQVSKVLTASQKDVADNGLRAGLERGVIVEIAPLDTSSPQGIVQTIGKRIEQAEIVSHWAGKPVSPLDASEANALRGMLESLQPKDKSIVVAMLAQTLGPRASVALSSQLDDKDKPLALAFALGGSKTTNDRFASELVLKGAAAIKDGSVMKDDKKVTGWKATIAAELEGVFPDAKLSQSAKDAAYYIAAGIAQEKGGSLNGSDIERSVRLAVGGQIIERNGRKLPVPVGVDADVLEKRLSSVTGDELRRQAPDGKVRAGGVEVDVDGFARTLPGQELIYAGPGRYAVIVRGRPVVNAAGRPIILGVQ